MGGLDMGTDKVTGFITDLDLINFFLVPLCLESQHLHSQLSPLFHYTAFTTWLVITGILSEMKLKLVKIKLPLYLLLFAIPIVT